MNPILNYWQPKDIPEVLKEFNRIKGIDKLIFKYYGYPEPHRLLDEFIKKHTEYDWFILMTNDVVVRQDNLDQLIRDVKNNDYPIISGVMNVDMDENRDYWNICLEQPREDYKWVKRGTLSGIQKVEFAGFPLMAIHESVFRKFNWYIENWNNNATDRRFCEWCSKNDIPIYVNTENEMKHLRFRGEMLVGKREPKTDYIINSLY